MTFALPLLAVALLASTQVLAASDNNAEIEQFRRQLPRQHYGQPGCGRPTAAGQQSGNRYWYTRQCFHRISQKLDTAADPSLNAKAAIRGNSFSNGNGVIGVNQSAGADNQMINAVRIGISAQPQGIDDSALSQQNVALLPGSGTVAPVSGSRQVVTSDQAFTGSRGVVQLNQSAGVGNRMANTLNIRVAD